MLINQATEVIDKGQQLLTVNNTTVQGILLVVILVSWLIIWQLWKANKELNEKLFGFSEKYYTLSTKILTYLSQGKNV